MYSLNSERDESSEGEVIFKPEGDDDDVILIDMTTHHVPSKL